MWLFAMFDLPVKTNAERRAYTRFRTALLCEGFCQLQYSVYGRYCGSDEFCQAVKQRVRALVPEKGQVRLLAVTERQFGRMEVLHGRKRRKAEEPPEQLLLF
jgi:CRISPR-associated protein Cas2